jgi:hypothetical protein
MIAPDPAAKPFAWEGIRLSIPASWDTGHLDRGYALLESRLRPVLEFKTAVIRGRFSFRRQMRLMARTGRRAGSRPMEWIAPPADWPAFPATSDVRAFHWQGRHVGGQGLLHYCRPCRRATLLQFYDDDGFTAALPRVLASFKDHDFPSGPRIAVYDIDATLPPGLELLQFQFEAGRFKLVFGPSGERVTLWRLSPADVLLERRKGDLTGIVRDNALLPPEADPQAGRPCGGGMEWHWPQRPRKGLRAFFIPCNSPAICALRIWHLPGANRLLAVCAEGLSPYRAFERVCDAYGII